jgi:hypothetical protein
MECLPGIHEIRDRISADYRGVGKFVNSVTQLRRGYPSSVRMEELGYHWMAFMNFFIRDFY